MSYVSNTRVDAAAIPVLTHLTLPSLIPALHLLRTGFAGYLLDVQHGDITLGDAVTILQATASAARYPWARIGAVDAADIARLLDNGCTGIIAPMIESAAQARALVDACLYPPLGTRSFGPVAPGLYAESGAGDLGDHANALVAPVVQIESARGHANLDEILAVPGIGGVYIGPADLARSMGAPFGVDQTDGPVADAVRDVAERCRAVGIPVGLFCADPAFAAEIAASTPLDFVALGGDVGFLTRAAASALTAFATA